MSIQDDENRKVVTEEDLGKLEGKEPRDDTVTGKLMRTLWKSQVLEVRDVKNKTSSYPLALQLTIQAHI